MIDVLLLTIVPAVATVTAFLLGLRAGRRARGAANAPAAFTAAVCSCGDAYGMHYDGQCHGARSVAVAWEFNRAGWYAEASAWEERQCQCRVYAGPVPFDATGQPMHMLSLPQSEETVRDLR